MDGTTVERSVTAVEAAQALVVGIQNLAPTRPPTEIHLVVHRAARTLQAALAEGVGIPEILDTLVSLTAPAVPEAPPPPPWAGLLGLSLDAFAATGTALGVAYPALQVSTWWSGSEAQARRIIATRGLTAREVWKLPRLEQEAARAGLDVETATVQQLLVALGGEVRRLAAGGVRRVVESYIDFTSITGTMEGPCRLGTTRPDARPSNSNVMGLTEQPGRTGTGFLSMLDPRLDPDGPHREPECRAHGFLFVGSNLERSNLVLELDLMLELELDHRMPLVLRRLVRLR